MKYLVIIFGLMILSLFSMIQAQQPQQCLPLLAVAGREADTGTNIYLVDFEGNLQQLITGGYQPTWSPNGRQIAFVFGSNIWILEIATGEFRNLTERFIGDAGFPSWSPDGEHIAFHGSPYGHIFVLDTDGENLFDLTLQTRVIRNRPTWSPDSSAILFAYYGLTIVELGVMRETRKLVEADTDDLIRFPAWSPDGQTIAFSLWDLSSEGTPENIFLIDADGGNLRQLTNGGVNIHATWSPDGSQIAYTSRVNGQYQIRVINADGSEVPQQINANLVYAEHPAWRPCPVDG